MSSDVKTGSLWSQIKGSKDPDVKSVYQDFVEYNESIGLALGELGEQPQDIQGREKEIALLYAVLERPRTPVALLLGAAGVGKTALVEQFGKELNAGTYYTELDNEYLLIALRVGNLAAIGVSRLQSVLATLFNRMREFEVAFQEALDKPNLRVVLFIDEVHMIVTIFGPGTKIGGDVMKDVLARAPIRIIAATTRREYDSTIAVDKPLSERFKQIEMQEISADVVCQVARDWWKKVASDCPYPKSQVIDRLIEANAMYRSDSAEPRKTLDIMEDLVSYSRRTGKRAEMEQLSDVFRQRYSINLDFRVQADAIYAEIERRLEGQPHALFTLRRLLRSMMFQLTTLSNRPMATALFTGSTGVGKTETVKAIASAMYPEQRSSVMLNVNMPDYKTLDSEESFRRRLGEFVRHTPNAIVLLDEFEKAHDAIKDTMLAVLDEGVVNFTTINRENRPEVNSVSMRNTIVIATTNAGHQVFANDAQLSDRGEDLAGTTNEVDKANIERLLNTLQEHLQTSGFKPEMLGRFDRIVPYRSLSEATLLRITERQLEKLAKEFREARDIEIEFDQPRMWEPSYHYVTTDVALYIAFIRARAQDSNSGGARAIHRAVKSNVQESIIDAVYEHPNARRFKVSVSRDSAIYSAGALPSEGGVVVEPIDA